LTIEPSSSSDDSFSSYETTVTVVAAATEAFDASWDLTDPTEWGVTISGTSNEDSLFFIYIAPTNIYNADIANFGNLSAIYAGDMP